MSPKNDHQKHSIMMTPISLWRSFRDVNVEAWAQGTANIVNTDAFSQILGLYLDSYLALYAPFQKVLHQYQETSLAQLNLPSRTELTALAQRMTHIELRLDDLDARIDHVLHTLRAQAPVIVEMLEEQMEQGTVNGQPASPGTPQELETRLQTLDEKTETLLRLLETLHATPSTPSMAVTRAEQPQLDLEPPSAADLASDQAIEGFQNTAS